MEFIVSVHVKNSEKHKNKIPLSTKPNGKPASKRKHQTVLSDWQINIKQSFHCHENNWFWERPKWQLVRQSRSLRAEPPFVFFLTEEDASTDYTTTVSGKDPNIILLDKHTSTCKTESGSENASNKTCWTLYMYMDNQESTDFITLNP